MSPAASADKRQISFSVSSKVHQRVQAMANTAGMSLAAYATLLFEAAYASRCNNDGDTGDVDLDTAVGRVTLLFGTGFDSASIQSATGLSEAFVERTLAAWQAQLRGDPMPAKTKIKRNGNAQR